MRACNELAGSSDPSNRDSIRMLRLRRQFGTAGGPSCLKYGKWALPSLLATCLLIGLTLAAEPTFRDEMDGAQPVLRLSDDSNFQIISQHIDRDRQSRGAEVLKLLGPAGESAQLKFQLPSAPVIAELRLSAMIRCNRPGVQIAARVVLPRSRDSKTGLQRELLVRGGNISLGLVSERMVLSEIPKQLERQARVARLQSTDPLDEREAYISQLVFLVPGGPGGTEFSVDWIALEGIVQDRIVDPNLKLTAASEAVIEGPLLQGTPRDISLPANPQLPVRETSDALVHRIVQWQGESFEFLARLGFNAIWISRLPTPDELGEASRLGISLVSPPPNAEDMASNGLPAIWDPVLAWDMGQLIARDDLVQVGRLRQLIRQHDSKQSRLTVMTCEQLSRDASRMTDAIVLGREMLGTDLRLRDYVTWLGQRQRLARPGTPIWATIESEFAPLRAQQVAALRGKNDPASLFASYDQLTALTTAAMSVKCRDYVFTSHSSLSAKDPVSQQRARNLELINLRLQLLTPWLATGKVSGIDRSSEPGVSAMVFQAERSHLLVPVGWSRDFRSQQSFHVPGAISFVVPGVAETTDVYLLSLGGAKRLRHERTTGGLRVSADSLPPDGLIMLTSDPQAFSQVSQYVRKIARRAATLHRDATAYRLDELEKVAAAEGEQFENLDAIRAVLKRANQSLMACDQDLARGFAELALQRTNEIERLLSQAEYVLRNGNGAISRLVTPLEFSTSTLIDERHLRDSLLNAPAGPQLVAGGDFESLEGLLQQGWRHQQLPLPGIASAVRLSPDTPHQGTYCLELEACAADASSPISVVPTAPVWISTPAMPIRAGDLVEITGVARIPEELIGTVDGLQIIDSLGGPGMATRIVRAPDWQSFRVLQGATADTQLVISLALSGLGRAQIDELTVRTLQRNGLAASRSAVEIRK